MGEPSPQKPPEPAEEPMQFDVSITINKARGLPLPPLFYSNPIVECLWGEPDPALLGSSSSRVSPNPNPSPNPSPNPNPHPWSSW